MQVTDNKSVYSTVEFDSWAHRSGLVDAESFLINGYLDKQGKTLEAGTGGGKILLEMKRLGFEFLWGFDFVSGLVEQARRRDNTGSICFDVGDAVRLEYSASFFDQIIYLQQIICLLDDDVSRLRALREAHRVLKPGGKALFSFLSFDARVHSFGYRSYIAYLSLLRSLRMSKVSIQNLPWLKLGGKLNLGSVLDWGPYVYWYKAREISNLLCGAGFQVTAIGSSHQIERGEMCKTVEILEKEPITGMLYVVCTK